MLLMQTICRKVAHYVTQSVIRKVANGQVWASSTVGRQTDGYCTSLLNQFSVTADDVKALLFLLSPIRALVHTRVTNIC